MKFVVIFLAVSVVTALAVPVDSTSSSVSNNNSNVVISNNNNNNNVNTNNSNITNNGNSSSCPSGNNTSNGGNNNSESDKDAISGYLGILKGILNVLGGLNLDVISGALGISSGALKSLIQLLSFVIKLGEGAINGLSGEALNALIQPVQILAETLSSLNPMLQTLLKPLTTALGKLGSNPSSVTLAKTAVNSATSILSNLLGSSLSGTQNVTSSIANELVKLVPTNLPSVFSG